MVRERYGRFASLVGVATNLILFGIKLAVGLVFNSLAITADAINNLSDSSSSLVTLAGFKMSGKPADEKHPYGHERIEYIAGLIVSFLILSLGFELLQTAFGKILHPEPTEFSWLSVGVLAVSIAIKFWQMRFYRSIGHTIDSVTLLATAADSRNDVLATSAVLMSLMISRFTGLDLDGYMGAAVALFIMVSGVKLIMERSAPCWCRTRPGLVSQISERILSYPGVIGLHDLAIHNYGPTKCYATVHCEISADMDPMRSHDLIDNIERDFLTDLGINLVIHMDPVRLNDPETRKLRAMAEGALAQIAPGLSLHDFRVVHGISHSNLIFDVTVPYSLTDSDDELVFQIKSAISSINPQWRCVIQVDRGYVQT
ncbi:MAG: cation diffusion facilitator family transporter [Clostridiales bacterium]|nr:cation diffusion facilitator family transporter [Clostridiales bacterium]